MVKKLSKCVGKYKKNSIITPIFVILQVIGEIVIPRLMSKILDNGIGKGNMEYIAKMGLILLLVAIFSLICGCIAGRNAAIASAGFAKNLRRKMYASVQDFSFSNIDKFSSASIITRLTTDVTNLQNAYQMIIFTAVRSPIMLIFSLAMSFSINQSLSLIFLVCIPFLALCLYLIVTHVYPIFTKVFRTYDKLNSVVEENLRGVRVVKSFIREDFEKKKFNKISDQIYKYYLKGEILSALNMPAMQLCMYSCTVLLAWFGARIIVLSGNNASGALSTGSLLSLITYALQILISLMILSMVLVIITISISSAKRVIEILDEESNLKNKENPIMYVDNGDVSFKNVSFSYVDNKKKLCLKDINLDIKSGEVVGLTGGTASGKSTLVHLISRLYDVTEGEVYVSDKNVKDYDINTLRDSVAVVLQKNTLFSGTIKENLRWGNENASDEEIKNVCKLAAADEFIEKMPQKYDTYIEEGGNNVSGGQKQRLCIARALLKKPKILVLDDSTSALDTRTDALIRKSLKETLPNTTKIIISQRISSVEDADKIIVMDKGKIVGLGKHEDLIKSCSVYRETYELQKKGGSISE